MTRTGLTKKIQSANNINFITAIEAQILLTDKIPVSVGVTPGKVISEMYNDKISKRFTGLIHRLRQIELKDIGIEEMKRAKSELQKILNMAKQLGGANE